MGRSPLAPSCPHACELCCLACPESQSLGSHDHCEHNSNYRPSDTLFEFNGSARRRKVGRLHSRCHIRNAGMSVSTLTLAKRAQECQGPKRADIGLDPKPKQLLTPLSASNLIPANLAPRVFDCLTCFA
ncbi:hypothetical protein BDV19DRAFT_333630 [Aspergillus venezuelensis]